MKSNNFATSLNMKEVVFGDYLQGLMTDYIEKNRVFLRPASSKFNQGILRRFFSWLDGREFNLTNTEIYRDEIIHQGKLATSWAYCKCLKAFGNWLERQDYLPVNPIKKLRLPKQKVRDEFVPSFEEALAIIDAGTSVDETDDKRVIEKRRHEKNCLKLMLLTGIRIGGATRLNVEDVDFINKTFRLELKGGSVVNSPMMVTVANHLKQAIGERTSGKIFPITAEVLRTAVHRGCAKLGLPKIRPHDLRASFATSLAYSDTPAPLLSKLLNHSKTETTSKYYIKADVVKMRQYLDVHHVASALLADTDSLFGSFLESQALKNLRQSGKFRIEEERGRLVIEAIPPEYLNNQITTVNHQ